MPALESGTEAPVFALPSVDGKQVSLQDALRRGPVVAAFFKISCPVCQFTFPYLERLHQAYRGNNVTFLGISQNPKADTAQFLKEYGVTFTTLVDDPAKYAASNAYGLTNVPTVFFIGQGGEIEQSIVGWSRKDMEQLSKRIAEAVQSGKAAPIFKPGEDVPDFKAG